MKTYDLFNTLATARYGTNAGEVPVEQHIPIAENIARVKPEDVIVSDYYDPAKAQRIVTEVCELDNQLVCTEDGKATGRVWQSVKSEHHLGDNLHTDFNSPRAVGIPAELTTLWQPTDREKACGDLGWAMREARLTTWHADPITRGLQLHQIERNFPFLLKVAHLLDAKMKAEGFTRLLLCSRDCYLLHRLMDNEFRTDYEIEYFYTSRLTRYRPSPTYAVYAKERLAGKTLVVDMNGSGNSLKHMTDAFGGTPLLICGFRNVVPCLVAGGIRETSNLAPHAMVSDVHFNLGWTVEDDHWAPEFVNPTGQDWLKPEIIESHNAFIVAVDCLTDRTIVPSYSLQSALDVMESPALAPLWADHLADSKAAYDLLNSGPLPHAVIL
jgi:hypothetical protein